MTSLESKHSDKPISISICFSLFLLLKMFFFFFLCLEQIKGIFITACLCEIEAGF